MGQLTTYPLRHGARSSLRIPIIALVERVKDGLQPPPFFHPQKTQKSFKGKKL